MQNLSPVAVMSFNRPDYLAQVLSSLLSQVDGRISERKIALFQDGAKNLSSGEVRAEQADIDACVDVFRRMVPGGLVFDSSSNIGVALNFERAEKFVFEELESEAAIFLEDDLVLNPHYVRSLDALIDVSLLDERIAHVAVYGHHWVPLDEQTRNPNKYVLLEHNWAFGLTRRQWLKNKPYVDEYLKLVRDVDYRQKPVNEIHKLFHSWGMGCPGDSQDVAKTIACCLNKSVKLNISACLGKYIGERGLHMNPEMFKQRQYAITQVYPEPVVRFEPLSDREYSEIFAVQHRWATERQCEFV